MPMHLAHIRRSIVFPENATANLFDPCCGKGLALAALGEGADCMTYGIELDEGRAEDALSHLARVGFGSYLPITAIWRKRSNSFP